MSKPTTAPPAETIHAIPTEYAGINFRSRLEAKWAAFFDLLKWRWEYEPVDFNGWIPDFALIGAKQVTYVEVKPVFKFPHETADKIDASGCEEPVLIVGAGNPMGTGYAGVCGPGWGRDDQQVWSPAVYLTAPSGITFWRLGTSPTEGAALERNIDLLITAHWRTAANETQWRRRGGLQHISEVEL